MVKTVDICGCTWSNIITVKESTNTVQIVEKDINKWKKNWETKHVYRVWYTEAGVDKEAFFTDKVTAQWFAEKVQETGATYAIVNRWRWEMKIEK